MRQFVFFLVMAAVPAAAQWRHFGGERWEPTGDFGIGPAAPVNPLATQLNTGFSLSGGFGATRGYAGIMGDFMFSNFGVSDSALAREGALSGGQRIWGLTVDPVVHINPRGPADFYLTGGLGLYGQRTELRALGTVPGSSGLFDLTEVNTAYKGGVNGGVGFAFNIVPHSKIKIFAEARIHHLFEQGPAANVIPITLGVRF